MNWMDLVFIGGITIGALLGMWVGLIRTAFALVALIVGTLLVIHLRDNVAGLLAEHVSSETLAAALGYAVTISIVFAGFYLAASIVRKIVYKLFLGWVDRLAGLAVGLIAAFVIFGVAIVGITEFGYSYELPRQGLAGKLLEKAPIVLESHERLRESLINTTNQSALVSLFMNATDWLPDGALDLVPPDFRTAMADLETQVVRVE